VNFASGTFTTDVPGFPIPGYQNDYGDLYGDRGNGQFFGWSEDNTANARLRSAANSPDARYDTLTHLQRNADMVWEIALTNGDYKVHLVGGDPTATDNTCQYLVEDQLTEAKAPAAGANWMDFNVSCTVSDGKLTIRSGPQAVNNKICFVDIVRSQAEPPAQPPVITLVSQKGGNITIQWTGGGTLQSSASLGSLAVWTDVSAGGSVTVPATGAVRFYRVRQ
jgi:hypothetical protein